MADDPSVQIVNIAQASYLHQMMQGTEWEGLPILSAAAPVKAGGRGGPDYYTDVAPGDVEAFIGPGEIGLHGDGRDVLLVTFGNGVRTVRDIPVLALIEVEGSGPDLWGASLPVFDAAVEKAYGGSRRIHW